MSSGDHPSTSVTGSTSRSNDQQTRRSLDSNLTQETIFDEWKEEGKDAEEIATAATSPSKTEVASNPRGASQASFEDDLEKTGKGTEASGARILQPPFPLSLGLPAKPNIHKKCKGDLNANLIETSGGSKFGPTLTSSSPLKEKGVTSARPIWVRKKASWVRRGFKQCLSIVTGGTSKTTAR